MRSGASSCGQWPTPGSGMKRRTAGKSAYFCPCANGSQGSSCPHATQTGFFSPSSRSTRSSGSGPPEYEMKSKKTRAAPGERPGVRIASTSSSSTRALTPYAWRSTLPTARGVATASKKASPSGVSRSIVCSADVSGTCNGFCRRTCNIRRDGSSRKTPRMASRLSSAACRPATPPTELQTHSTPRVSATTSATKSLSWSAQV
mmetsp:Transcript_14762/g.46129  ORF Transcript_14762/g.46129 Transcript_14762/m.46129 type:complete len:203 (-) Transcript_14762:343-951(-)